MAGSGQSARSLRTGLVAVVVIFLLGAGAAAALGRYERYRLERDAARDARRLAVEVLEPALTAADVAAPIRGTRYAELSALVRDRLLPGPIEAVRLWSDDGTALFADDRGLVGRRDPVMADRVHTVVAATRTAVEGDRFLVLTRLRVAGSDALVAVELERSHGRVVLGASARWDPWVPRALTGAAVAGGLLVVTTVAFATTAAARRAWRERAAAARAAAPTGARGVVAEAGLPAYMLPGFQDEVEARRRAEDALDEVTAERDALAERCRRLEAELDEARARLRAGPALEASAPAER